MAVIPQFNVCESSNCKELTFVETTGAYNAITNPNGWGAPNEATSAALTAVLTVTLASGNSYSIDLFSSGFPTTDSSIQFQIPQASIGSVDGIPFVDQVVNFTYTITTAGNTYTQNIQKAFYCQVKCCVLSMPLDIDLDCDCSQDKIDNAITAFILLKGLEKEAGCGNTSAFNNILTQLQKLCKNSNCQNCK